MSNRFFHPDFSIPLNPGWTFVFGSNDEGRHGKGAAATAYSMFGAEWGCGSGYRGESYAIATKQTPWKPHTLDLVHRHIEDFERWAASHDKNLFITRIGCMNAGFKDAQIAPLFLRLNSFFKHNISFPEPWKKYIQGI